MRFPALSRLLHWVMAVMILAMLFIGVGMTATESDSYKVLTSIHRPLGIAILALVAVRLINRLLNPPPSLPPDLSPLQRAAAHGSHLLLYALMFAMPLIGWGMLSAGALPRVLYGAWELPAILPQDPILYALLRHAHTVLAYVFFATILLHLAAALFHGMIRRDGVLGSMASLASTSRHQVGRYPT